MIRTAAGERLYLHIASPDEYGWPTDEQLRAAIIAIEQEAQFLRPRWHHDRSLSPEDRQYCEDCDDLIRRAETAEARITPAPSTVKEGRPR